MTALVFVLFWCACDGPGPRGAGRCCDGRTIRRLTAGLWPGRDSGICTIDDPAGGSAPAATTAPTNHRLYSPPVRFASLTQPKTDRPGSALERETVRGRCCVLSGGRTLIRPCRGLQPRPSPSRAVQEAIARATALTMRSATSAAARTCFALSFLEAKSPCCASARSWRISFASTRSLAEMTPANSRLA